MVTVSLLVSGQTDSAVLGLSLDSLKQGGRLIGETDLAHFHPVSSSLLAADKIADLYEGYFEMSQFLSGPNKCDTSGYGGYFFGLEEKLFDRHLECLYLQSPPYRNDFLRRFESEVDMKVISEIAKELNDIIEGEEATSVDSSDNNAAESGCLSCS